jgi:membrane protein DedA with SNARE-associated domain
VSAGIPYHRFLVHDFAGAILWTAVFVLAGRVLGEQAPRALERFGAAGLLGGVALAALGIAYIVTRRRRRAA